jgi:hypothetical protein
MMSGPDIILDVYFAFWVGCTEFYVDFFCMMMHLLICMCEFTSVIESILGETWTQLLVVA